MSSSDKKVPDPADNYFDTNTTLITLGFLATYFIIYAFINLFFDEDAHQTKASCGHCCLKKAASGSEGFQDVLLWNCKIDSHHHSNSLAKARNVIPILP